MTLCAYVKILRLEDTLRDQYYYIEVLKLAATVFFLVLYFLNLKKKIFRFIYKW